MITWLFSVIYVDEVNTFSPSGVRCLTTPTDHRVPPFSRIIDADPHRRHYLFGSQRPETRVETMSWYCRFLLLMTLARQVN
jgi:hypothetical protein